MQTLLKTLITTYPELNYTAGEQFCWSPETKEIFYNASATGQKAAWSLLHETGHALLQHTTYKADFELLKLEIAAWDTARDIATKHSFEIDEDHIEDCLDTYRDWLYKRSICPKCSTKCLQQDDYKHYHCFNCHTVWKVSANRFCRAYRSTKNVTVRQPIFRLRTNL